MSESTDADIATDVVVVGAGMAGLVAALRAAEAGADVSVLEKGPRAGGSMYFSNGVIYTYTTPQKAQEDVPQGNERLQTLVIESLDASTEWLERHGLEVTEPDLELPFGQPKKIQPEQFTAKIVNLIEERGGTLRFETPMRDLATDSRSTVEGVVANTNEGEKIMLDADNVVIATGGFQGSETLVEQYVTDHTENLYLRSNRWSTGDGIVAATDVGAQTTGGMGTFYGHNLPAPPATFSPGEFTDVTQYYEVSAVALDRRGERFTDESESRIGETIAQDAARETDGEVYYILDSDLYESEVLGKPVAGMVDNARQADGRVASADDFGELEETLRRWGVDGNRAVQTLKEYNTTLQTNCDESLDPPRRRNQRLIDAPPFYAVAVQPAITFTMGGLAVTDEMRVVDRTQSSSGLNVPGVDGRRAPISNLYAAGMDVGGIQRRKYFGGLAVALVTGLIAGEQASTV